MNTFTFASFRFRSILTITRMFVLMPFCLLCFAQTPNDATELSSAHPVERTLKGGETHTYRVNLKAGQFMRAEVNQSAGFDVIVSLYAPDGKLLIEMNAKNGFLWRESVSCIATTDGRYKIEIKPVEQSTVGGSYKVGIVELREPNERDRRRIAAEEAFGEGRSLYLPTEQSSAEVVKRYEAAIVVWREIGDRYWEAVTLTNLGWTYSDLSQNDKSIDSHNQALKLFQEIKDRLGEGKAANGLGIVYGNTKQYDKAKESYEQALAIRRELNDQRGVGRTLRNLGNVSSNAGQYGQAREYYEQALAINRDLKDQLGEGSTLVDLGDTYLNESLHSKMREYYEQALPIIKAVRARATERQILTMLGLYYGGQGQIAKARDYLEQVLVITREQQDRSGEADALNHLAMVYKALSEYEKARNHSEQALVIKRDLKDRRGEADVLGILGSVYESLRQYEKAQDCHQRELAIARDLKDRSREGTALGGLGEVYSDLREFEKAREVCEQALAIRRELKQRLLESGMLASLGFVHLLSGQPERARDLFEQSLAIKQELQDRAGEGLMLSNLGLVYNSLHQYEKAREYYERGLAVDIESNNRASEANSRQALGFIHGSLFQYDKAVGFFEQALAIRRELNDRRGESASLSAIGALYDSRTQYEKARGFYGQALTIAKELKDQISEGHLLIYLGNSYLSTSQFEEAREAYEQGLAVSREVKNQLGMSYALINLGLVYLNLNQYDKSREFYEQGLAMSRELKNQSNEMTTLLISGAAYSDLSQQGKALGYYEQALALSRELRDRRVEGVTLGAVGYVYFNLQQYKRAIDYYEQSLAIAREVKDRRHESYALNNLGEASLKLNQYDKARYYHEQGLAIAREVTARGSEYDAFNGLGDVYSNLRRYKQAQSYYERALAVAREAKSRKNEGKTLWKLMLLSNTEEIPQLAILYGKQAINAFQDIRGNIKSFDKDSRESFLKDRESCYRTLADILVTQGRLPEAETVLEMLKQEEFSDIKRGIIALNIHLTPNEDKAAGSSDQLARLAVELGDLNERFGKGTATKSDRERVKFIDARITEANREIKAVLIEVAVAAPKKHELNEHSLGIMGTLRSLGNGTVALYTVVTKEKGWVILTTPDFRRSYPIDVSDLEKKVHDFRQTLKSEQYDPVRNAQTLYRALFLQPNKNGRTLAADLRDYGAKTLMWSLDGVLRYVPIAALHDGQKYLVEQYRNVVFTGTDETRLAASGSSEWSVLGLGVSKPYADFPALRAVPRELHAIIKDSQSSTVGVLPGVIRLDEAFTRDSLIDGLRERRPVLHIASHVIFDVGRPAASFLLLGDGNHLTLEDLEVFPQYFEKIELLTLSACDTAVSGKANGRDAEGFAYAALGLGAKSVVGSLWSVSDEGTEVLMREFYRIKSAHPQMSKAEALQRAQLALIAGAESPQFSSSDQRKATSGEDASGSYTTFKRDPKARFGHPHYWAPFVLIGNWK